MLFVLGTTSIGNKTYTELDIKRLVPLDRHGLSDTFYGGRIYRIGETADGVLMLIENKEGLKVIDLAVSDEHLPKLPTGILRELCNRKKLIKEGDKVAKEEMVFRLTGKGGGENEKA